MVGKSIIGRGDAKGFSHFHHTAAQHINFCMAVVIQVLQRRMAHGRALALGIARTLAIFPGSRMAV